MFIYLSNGKLPLCGRKGLNANIVVFPIPQPHSSAYVDPVSYTELLRLRNLDMMIMDKLCCTLKIKHFYLGSIIMMKLTLVLPTFSWNMRQVQWEMVLRKATGDF